MGQRYRVKSKAFFQYTYLDSYGTLQASPKPGLELREYEPWVDPSGNTWVTVAGTAGVGGVAPNGLVVPFLADTLGNQRTALPDIQSQTTPLNSTSVAYEASRLVKPTQGVLMGFSGYSSRSSSQFILVFDYSGQTVPPVGTVPVVVIPIAAASGFSYDPGRFGRRFNAGIWITNSSTGPTLTIGSADCWFDAQYV